MLGVILKALFPTLSILALFPCPEMPPFPGWYFPPNPDTYATIIIAMIACIDLGIRLNER